MNPTNPEPSVQRIATMKSDDLNKVSWAAANAARKRLNTMAAANDQQRERNVSARIAGAVYKELRAIANEDVGSDAPAPLETAVPAGVERVTLKSHDDTAVQATVIGLGTPHVTILADGPIDRGVFYGYTVQD